MIDEDTSTRVIHDEDRWPWMNELPEKRNSSDEREALKMQGDKKRDTKRRSTLVQGSILEWMFEELISITNNIIKKMNSMK